MLVKFEINDTITIKDFIKNHLPQRLITTINQRGYYLVNNQAVKNYYCLNPGDLLEVMIPPTIDQIKPVNHPLKIVYEDSYMLIIDKEVANVTPTYHHPTDTIANYISGYYHFRGINSGIHLVSRLDRPTTGLMIVAKNPYIQYLFQVNPPKKEYLLTVVGQLESGFISSNIQRASGSGILREAVSGDNAKTSYQVIKAIGDNSLIKAQLLTGKTHQLRVHFASINHPILGDHLYGIKGDQLYLHSYHLSFIHPITKQKCQFTSLPKWLEPDQLNDNS